jgi:hypothetical protein
MVKETTFLKQKFYKNDNANGGAMAAAISNAKTSDIIVHSQTKKMGRLWGSMNPEKALVSIQANHGIYEVLAKFPLKVYFDIDKKRNGANPDEFLALCKTQILSVFTAGTIAISGSVTDEKLSYHIVLNNYLIENEEQLQHVKRLVKLLNEKNDSFDWKVYTKNRNMKSPNQSKLDGRVQEVMEGEDLKSHFISCFFDSEKLELPALPKEEVLKINVEKSKELFNLSDLPKMDLQKPAEVDLTKPAEILKILPVSTEFNHTYTHYVARFCFYNAIPFEMFYSWIQNKKSGIEYHTKWQTHWDNLNKFPPVSIQQIKRIVYQYHPNLKVDKFFLKFRQAFDFAGSEIKKINRIEPEHFDSPEKFIVFNVGMGGGKTAQTIDYLKKNDSYLWVAPNIALAENTAKRIGDEVSLYTNFTPKQKKEGVFKTVKKLIICQNSMHYVKEKYKVVVIDEIETLLLKFQGEFIDKNGYKLECWENFLKVIRNADKVILLDAFTTAKTLNFIKNFSNDILIYERMEEKTPRKIIFINQMQTQMLKILEDLQAGKKLFIFYPPKRANKSTMSMANLFEMIQEETGAKGVFYNADVNEDIKKGLENVNKTWKEEQVIITNTCITCGVNYDQEDFDAIYLFITKYSSPRDVIQVSYRPRTIKENKIYACFISAGVVCNSWHNDKAAMECRIYNKLYDDCMIEFKSPQKTTFHYFCEKAGYTQENEEKDKLEKDIEKSYKKLFEKYNFSYDYSKIENIGFKQIDELQNKVFTKTATMEEKLSLKKYFFNLNFRRDADREFLAEIWDAQQLPVFEKMTKLRNEDHFFHQIRKLNEWDTIFPPEEFEFDKIKINDSIKNDIFENMNFKWIGKQTATTKLMKEVYNEFWGMTLIKSKLDENKHAIYNYSKQIQTIKNLYDFGLKNYQYLMVLEEE